MPFELGSRSPVYVLVNDRLEGRLPEILQDLVDEGRSWRDISLELARRNGVKVSHETIRAWCKTLGIERAA